MDYSKEIAAEVESDRRQRAFDVTGPQVDRSYIIDTPQLRSRYRIWDDRVEVFDAAWGYCSFGEEKGDEIYLDLVTSRAVARTLAIEQLILPPFMTTIAGTADMPRYEHIWGSTVFTRKLGMKLGIAAEELRKCELRAFLSDITQFVFSHLPEFPEFGLETNPGSESSHDKGQKGLLAIMGITEIVESHNYNIDELLVIGQKPDWVEADKPEIKTDNIDYGTREGLRWLGDTADLWKLGKDLPFEIDEDGMLAFTSLDAARMFTRVFMMLVTEHHQAPIHRIQLKLLTEMVRNVIAREGRLMMDPLFAAETFHPQEMLMTIDSDFDASFYEATPFTWVASDLGRQIGSEARMLHRTVRMTEISAFVRGSYEGYPDPLISTVGHGLIRPGLPSNVVIYPVESPEEVDDFQANPQAVDFFFGGKDLKHRQIDPRVIVDGVSAPLSKYDNSFEELNEQQKKIMARSFVGRILVGPEHKKIIEEGIEFNNNQWPAVLERPHMTEEQFRVCIEFMGGFGIGTRKVEVDWLQ